MNKEEILEKSRQENNQMDEMEMNAHTNSCKLAMYIGRLVCAVILLLDAIFSDHINMSTWAVYCAMDGTAHIYLFLKLRHKSDLCFGIIYLIAGVLFFARYVVGLTVL